MATEIAGGSEISHYRIISKIGAGGMGEVYLAVDTKLERQVALKVLLAEVANDVERVQRFVHEAKAASALNHPNILTVFEIGLFEGLQYIATEFIKGVTLRERMRLGGLGLNEALGVALHSAAALGAAHEAGIIHRDIKPDNIMIRDDGLVKVLDFGLAKLTEKRDETADPEDATKTLFSTKPGMLMGTVAYMSPEQARGQPLDARSDIFSLGIVMYELFTGKRPFEGESSVDLISSILKDEPPSLRQWAPDLPRQLERIVDKALRKDREHRYQHVKDLEIDLDDLRDELKFEAKLNKPTEQTLVAQQTGTEGPRPTLTESISTTRRFTLLHAILFGLVAAGLIVGVWFFRASLGGTAPNAANVKTTELASWSSAAGELFSNAAFSPDGKLIAFSSTRSGTKNIWVTQGSSSEPIQVTNDSFSNKDPIWSPKGDEIAYFSEMGNISDGRINSTGVWRVSALGGTPKSVGAVSDGSTELRRWTASGKIYFQSGGNLHALDINSGASERVTELDPESGKIDSITISADEDSIAYVRTRDGKWQLFTSDLANSRPSLIADGTGEVGGFAWLPEKNRFYLSLMADGVFQVFVIEGSATPVRITSTESDSIVLDPSPDGKSIIVSSTKEESDIWRVMVEHTGESPVSRSVNAELWPAVSPDSSRIVFQSAKNLSRGNKLFDASLMVKSLGSRDDSPTQLAEKGFLAAWSPDGSAIAFLRKQIDGPELMVANPNGGGERKLTSGGIPMTGYSVSPYNNTEARAFSWSPDSSKIAYVSNRSGAANIWAVSARDGADAALTTDVDADRSVYSPSWSADGRRLAFLSQKLTPDANGKNRKKLNIIDVATGNTSVVFETDKIIRFLGWTADENGLIIAETERSSGLPPEIALKRIAIGTGEETSIDRLKNAYYYNIVLSADRRSLAFAARNDDIDDIWVLSSSGGKPKKLTGNNDSGLFFSRLAWLPDGSAIVFAKQTRFSLLSMITGIE